jgi:hypothetical protein
MNAKSDSAVTDGSGHGLHPLDPAAEESAVANGMPGAQAAPLSSRFPLSEGIRKSKEAFLRDLPDLMRDPSLRGKWVVYHGDDRIGIDDDDEPLINECRRRGLAIDEYIIETIEPKHASPERVEFPLAWQ